MQTFYNSCLIHFLLIFDLSYALTFAEYKTTRELKNVVKHCNLHF